RWKYTGREYQSDLKWQYNRARWYDTTTGRWITEDPSGFSAGDFSLSRYVGNNPMNATDPNGLELLAENKEIAKDWVKHYTETVKVKGLKIYQAWSGRWVIMCDSDEEIKDAIARLKKQGKDTYLTAMLANQDLEHWVFKGPSGKDAERTTLDESEKAI